jgi:hypothetical protein
MPPSVSGIGVELDVVVLSLIVELHVWAISADGGVGAIWHLLLILPHI